MPTMLAYPDVGQGVCHCAYATVRLSGGLLESSLRLGMEFVFILARGSLDQTSMML